MKNILEQKKIVGGIIAAVLVLLVGGYFWYSSSGSDDSSSAGKVDPTLFTPEVKNFYSVKDSINLDNTFMKGKNEEFFNNLHSYTQPIPLKEPSGRPNPFVPYVAP